MREKLSSSQEKMDPGSKQEHHLQAEFQGKKPTKNRSILTNHTLSKHLVWWEGRLGETLQSCIWWLCGSLLSL